MRTNIQILPGVGFIGWVDCDRLLPNVAMRAAAGMAVPVLTDIHRVDFFGEPIGRCVTERDEGGDLDTATLNFRSPTLLPTDAHMGFVVMDQQGGCYLIGAAEKPFPTVKVTAELGTPDGDPAGYSYEVTHKAIRSLVACNV